MTVEQLTTYRVQGKEIGLVFLFKYDLNGFIRAWEVSEGELNAKQSLWLFAVPDGQSCARFPANEAEFKARWLNNDDILEKFDISTRPADISFEALWILYDHKVAKQDAMKSFNKLKEDEKIKCFTEIPYYLDYLKRNPGIGKLHLATYINKRRFEDERPVITSKKNSNPALRDLASQKTIK
jgi:hypothetical protein